jgi:hypothetical protein
MKIEQTGSVLMGWASGPGLGSPPFTNFDRTILLRTYWLVFPDRTERLC